MVNTQSKPRKSKKVSKNLRQTGKVSVSNDTAKATTTSKKRSPPNFTEIEHTVGLDRIQLGRVVLPFVLYAWDKVPKNTILSAFNDEPNWAEICYCALMYDLLLATRGTKSVFKEVPRIYDDLRSAMMPKTANDNGLRHSYKFDAGGGAIYPINSPVNPTTGLQYLAPPVDVIPATGVRTLVEVPVPTDPIEAIDKANDILWKAYKSAGARMHTYGHSTPSPLTRDPSAFAVGLLRPSESDFSEGNTVAGLEVQAPAGGVTKWLAALRLAVYCQDRYSRYTTSIDFPSATWMGDRILRGRVGNERRHDTVIIRVVDYTMLWQELGGICNAMLSVVLASGINRNQLTLDDVPGNILTIEATIRFLTHAVQSFYLGSLCVYGNVGLNAPIAQATHLPMAGQFQPPSTELMENLKLPEKIVESLRRLAPATTKNGEFPWGDTSRKDEGQCAMYTCPVAIRSNFTYYPTQDPEYGFLSGWVDAPGGYPWDEWSLGDGAGLAINNNHFGLEGSQIRKDFDEFIDNMRRLSPYCAVLPTYNTVNRNGSLTMLTRVVAADNIPPPQEVVFGVNAAGGSWKLTHTPGKATLSLDVLKTAEPKSDKFRTVKVKSTTGFRDTKVIQQDPFAVGYMSASSTISPEMNLMAGMVMPQERLFVNFNGSSGIAQLMAYRATKGNARSYSSQPTPVFVSDYIVRAAVSTVHPSNTSQAVTELQMRFKKDSAVGDGGLIEWGGTLIANSLAKKGKISEKTEKNIKKWTGVADTIIGIIPF